MNKLPLLLKREYWEHRGGFVWTPAWITGAMLILTVLGIVSAEVFRSRAQVSVVGFSADVLRKSLDAGDIAGAANALDIVQLTLVSITCIGLFFVAFFYLLGALYDDRRDRSVLFWKSLPVSDTATVASKALSVMLVMPAIVLFVATIAYLVFLALISLWVAAHGLNPLPVLVAAHPFGMFARLAALLPLWALWALPTIGWLLFWSAWARSKPFLWAVLLPVVVLVADKWLGLLGAPTFGNHIPLGHVLGRLLFSVMPGSWFGVAGVNLGKDQVSFNLGDDDHVMRSLDLAHNYGLLGSADLWIGVVAGLAMLAAAMWLRGRRIETSV